MGTEYRIYKDDSLGDLLINEMSNKLSLCFNCGPLYTDYETNEMTPEEMAKIFLKGLTVCSYWMDTGELKALIYAHMGNEIY